MSTTQVFTNYKFFQNSSAFHETRIKAGLGKKTSHVNVTFSQILCLRLGETFDVSLDQVESFGKGLVQPSIQRSQVRKLGDGSRRYDNLT